MVAISFSVFKDKLLDGSKTQTIRKPRKNPIRAGDKLQLYWKQRSKESKNLFDAVCTETFFVELADDGRLQVWMDGEPMSRRSVGKIIHADGFGSAHEFRDWFVGHYNLSTPTEFQVIRWKKEGEA